MQDFDFGKYYKRQNGVAQSSSVTTADHAFSRKLTLLGTIVLLSFFTGMGAGIYYQKNKLQPMTNPAANQGGHSPETKISANINNAGENHANEKRSDESKNESEKSNGNIKDQSAITQTLQSDEAEYIILAKIYSSREEAHFNGMKLKKEGLPVFLAENGNKMKVYVGPIAGKNNAYEMLGKIKRNQEFQGAILYKK